MNTVAGYEWVDKNFQPVERLSPVEFSRDWGLPLLLTPATEQLPSFSIRIEDDKGNNAQYKFDSYIRSDGFKGIRNVVNYTQNVNGWNFNGIFNLTNSNTPTDKGYYFRPIS